MSEPDCEVCPIPLDARACDECRQTHAASGSPLLQATRRLLMMARADLETWEVSHQALHKQFDDLRAEHRSTESVLRGELAGQERLLRNAQAKLREVKRTVDPDKADFADKVVCIAVLDAVRRCVEDVEQRDDGA